MGKIVASISVMALFICIISYGNFGGTKIPFAAPEESSTAPQMEPETIETNETTNTKKEEQPKSEPTNDEKDKSMKISVKSTDYEIIYKLGSSQAAKDLYAQLPLTTKVEPFSNNEMTFYPPKKLNTSDTPLSKGKTGSLSYYSPWGDVVMFYAPCDPNGSLYELGTIISGKENIEKLKGTITVSAYEE